MIICIIGKTNSGKDTVANYLSKKYGIELVCSYTTRPPRDYETDGVQHHFISDEKMDEILEKETVLAFTENEKTGVRYCASLESIEGENCIYIINPEGIKWMKNAYPQLDIFGIYVHSSETDISNRSEKRGDKKEDFEKRIESEREEFDSYFQSGDWDFCIYNYKDLDYLLEMADTCYTATLKPRIEFVSAYNKCFYPNGEMKACGREACKDLLDVVNKYYDGDFGDIQTGKLATKEIIKLRGKL